MQTIKLWLTAITMHIEKRKQKQRKITKPETKQVELGDRSGNSENKEQQQGQEQIQVLTTAAKTTVKKTKQTK